jgi:hypothetical protein
MLHPLQELLSFFVSLIKTYCRVGIGARERMIQGIVFVTVIHGVKVWTRHGSVMCLANWDFKVHYHVEGAIQFRVFVGSHRTQNILQKLVTFGPLSHLCHLSHFIELRCSVIYHYFVDLFDLFFYAHKVRIILSWLEHNMLGAQEELVVYCESHMSQR